MQSPREIRYYASIPKLLLILLGAFGFVAVGWLLALARANPILIWLDIGFFGLGALVMLVQIALVVVFRRPMLLISNSGITTIPYALQPNRLTMVPWQEIAGIGIRVQQLPRTRQYYFIVQARRPEDALAASSGMQRLSVKMYPSLAQMAINLPLNTLFLFTTRKRRARLLEHIQMMFAPELIQYNIWVDQQERPL